MPSPLTRFISKKKKHCFKRRQKTKKTSKQRRHKVSGIQKRAILPIPSTHTRIKRGKKNRNNKQSCAWPGSSFVMRSALLVISRTPSFSFLSRQQDGARVAPIEGHVAPGALPFPAAWRRSRVAPSRDYG